MKEDFVTYEQALALKELGFNEETYTYYNIGDTEIKGLPDRFSDVTFDSYNKWNNSLSAPSLAEAHKWIRSKGLFIKVFPELVWKEGWELDVYNIKGDFYYHLETFKYITYEEALLDGISCCIKILNKKKQTKNYN